MKEFFRKIYWPTIKRYTVTCYIKRQIEELELSCLELATVFALTLFSDFHAWPLPPPIRVLMQTPVFGYEGIPKPSCHLHFSYHGAEKGCRKRRQLVTEHPFPIFWSASLYRLERPNTHFPVSIPSAPGYVTHIWLT